MAGYMPNFLPMKVSSSTENSMAMRVEAGVPTLSMDLKFNVKISVPELLRALSSWQEIPPPRMQEAELRQAPTETETALTPFRNALSYGEYLDQHKWTKIAVNQPIVLSDERSFRDAKFVPIPLPARERLTYATYAKRREAQPRPVVKPPPNYPAPAPPSAKSPPKAQANVVRTPPDSASQMERDQPRSPS
ncbi:unnamed protein product [Effrenium voratum]|uniref:Uncharacterized protein n=1 Tax=Effrenium voratum TaxID=2562239 RepID=A0AA36JCI6_9DINO|nr:unnamed protein product [Effrenium voratum]